MLNFDDGIKINTSGELRVIRLSDGYYVIGKGLCIPVNSREEGKEMIAELSEKEI